MPCDSASEEILQTATAHQDPTQQPPVSPCHPHKLLRNRRRTRQDPARRASAVAFPPVGVAPGFGEERTTGDSSRSSTQSARAPPKFGRPERVLRPTLGSDHGDAVPMVLAANREEHTIVDEHVI